MEGKYATPILILESLLVFTLLLGISYLIYIYTLEKGRKKEALRNLRLKHEALTLALEGGKTYAWCFDGKTAVFDQAFCELTNRSQNLLEIKEIANYVHPGDQAQFRKTYPTYYTGHEEQPNTVANSTTPVTNGGNSDTACCSIMNKILSSPDFW